MNVSTKASKRVFRTMIRSIILGAILGGMFVAGFVVRDMLPHEPTKVVNAQTDPSHQFPLLNEVNALVSGNFYRDLPEGSAMEYAAIRGYLTALSDPYSFFNDPPVAQSESDALAGIYGGIGVVVKRNVEGLIELYPYPDSPAERLGVLDGDILLAINGQELNADERIDVIQQFLRGEVKDNNGVEITVRHISGDEENLQIPFEQILVPSLLWRVLPGEPVLGYIHLTSFTSRSPEELAIAIEELRNNNISGLILDLRNNYGGLLQESIDIAGEFLDGGIILIEQSRKSGEIISEDTPGGLLTDLPMIVITNHNSASAAEVVAAALQQNGRAQILGQATHGKGSVQLIFRLSDNSSFRITGAIWLTPNRSPLDGVGLKPDIEMIPDENGRDVELAEAIQRLSILIPETVIQN